MGKVTAPLDHPVFEQGCWQPDACIQISRLNQRKLETMKQGGGSRKCIATNPT
jgi:hypothetical protein